MCLSYSFTIICVLAKVKVNKVACKIIDFFDSFDGQVGCTSFLFDNKYQHLLINKSESSLHSLNIRSTDMTEIIFDLIWILSLITNGSDHTTTIIKYLVCVAPRTHTVNQSLLSHE